MITQADRHAVARQAEAVFTSIVEDVEKEIGVELPRLREVRYTIDQAERRSETDQEPYHRLFPRLRAQPFWRLNQFPEPVRSMLGTLESEFPKLGDEFKNALSARCFEPGHTGYFGVAHDWRQLEILRQDMTFTSEALANYPHLRSVLEPLVEWRVARKCYFALLRPGAHLQNHCGGTNLFLRVHLGVVVPEGDTALRVGGETRRWLCGRVLIFDDSFGHEAWNYTDQDRYILLLRLLHPDLSDAERHWLPVINHRFSATDASHAVEEVLKAFTPQNHS